MFKIIVTDVLFYTMKYFNRSPCIFDRDEFYAHNFEGRYPRFKDRNCFYDICGIHKVKFTEL